MNTISLYKKLSEIPTGNEVFIASTDGDSTIKKRLSEMGFIKGKSIKVIKNAPLLDPIEYEILGYNVSLRRQEANLIKVVDRFEYLGINEKLVSDINHQNIDFNSKIFDNTLLSTKKIKVALIGNPNCGKTTLFNNISKSRQRVGNYVGVTVEAIKSSIIKDGYNIEITDLPGTYSIFEFSPEEIYVREHIINEKPDIIINVVDASNLERNLFLTTQLMELNSNIIIALNMFDAIDEIGDKIDTEKFNKLIGIPIIKTIASKGFGVSQLFDSVIKSYKNNDTNKYSMEYHEVIEDSINNIEDKIIINENIKYSSRFLAIKLLENDSNTKSLLNIEKNLNLTSALNKEKEKLNEIFGENSETLIIRAKYDFINNIVNKVYTKSTTKKEKSYNIDNLLTHKYLGYPIFLIFMFIMFQSTFTLGAYPMDWIDSGVSFLNDFLKNLLPIGPFRDLLLDGIFAGVGGVIVFLPNILILFFFISIMEDTGYMARASFIMDKLMHKIGLHGKSFIPLVMGFGCNVPAIMATKTIENRKDRILTMLITPLMSCSARLPVYLLIIAAIFDKAQGLVLLSIYMIGILLAIIVAKVTSKFSYKKESTPFVLELPPYRIPTFKNVILHMWDKGSQYIKKMGTVILSASIIIWALGYFPKNDSISKKYDTEITKIENINLPNDTKEIKINELKTQKASELQEYSFIGRIGKSIEPIITPLGFDWKIGISIITGLAAKEIVLSTMGTLYQGHSDDESSLSQKIKEQKYNSGAKIGQPVFTPITAYSFMVFILIYFPCVAVISAIKKESSWKYAIITMVYTTILAWFVSYLVYNLGTIFIG